MKRIWVTQDGREIPVRKMSDSHLKNAYKMMVRKGFVSPATFDFYLLGPMPSGEMALDAYEREQDMVFESPILTQMGWLEEELERRKIDRWEII